MNSRVPDKPLYFKQPAAFSDRILLLMTSLQCSTDHSILGETEPEEQEQITDFIIERVTKAKHFLVIPIPLFHFYDNIIYMFRPEARSPEVYCTCLISVVIGQQTQNTTLAHMVERMHHVQG